MIQEFPKVARLGPRGMSRHASGTLFEVEGPDLLAQRNRVLPC